MPTGMYFSGAEEQSNSPRRSLRVLVVDDERDIVLTLMAILRDEGHETKGAYTGPEALAAIVDFNPDVMIADISMPGMNGWDLARQVRKIGGEMRPLMIAVSGHYKGGADKALGQMAGFNHYVTKPCDPNEILT